MERFSSIILCLCLCVSVCVTLLWKVQVWHGKYLHISLHYSVIFACAWFYECFLDWNRKKLTGHDKSRADICILFSHASFHLIFITSRQQFCRRSALVYLTGVVCCLHNRFNECVSNSSKYQSIDPNFPYLIIHPYTFESFWHIGMLLCESGNNERSQ